MELVSIVLGCPNLYLEISVETALQFASLLKAAKLSSVFGTGDEAANFFLGGVFWIMVIMVVFLWSLGSNFFRGIH